MDFISLLQGAMDWVAVCAAIVVTQAVKYALPSPTVDRTTETMPGHLGTRMLPFVPIVVGIGVVFLRRKFAGSTEALDPAFVRGIVSGMAAAYFYRSTKVSFFGE